MKFYGKLLSFSLLIFLSTFAVVNAQKSKKNKIGKSAPRPAPKIGFISGSNSLNIPFELSNNLILLQARVNDSEPVWFILDTGAESTVIDTRLAKSLGLKSVGKDYGSGSAGSAEAAIYRNVSFSLPNIEADNQTFYGLPIDFFDADFGTKISGIIGLDILKNFVVEIDYASRLISFYAPQSYHYSGNGEIVSFTVGYENLLFIPAVVEAAGGKKVIGRFELDTGSTGAILLNSPFVNKNNLLKLVSKPKRVKTGGIGGSGSAFIGRIKNLKLGNLTLENPIANFYQDTKGDNASTRYDGLIGGAIFRRFKVIFDTPRRRLILEPNEQFSEPFEADMSGLSLLADGDDLSILLVDDVEANSPAAQAGIRGGDTIAAIDDHPAEDFSLDQVRRMFKQDGKEYLLTVKRGGETIKIRLKLKRAI